MDQGSAACTPWVRWFHPRAPKFAMDRKQLHNRACNRTRFSRAWVRHEGLLTALDGASEIELALQLGL